ncbi:MAG: type II toxin-antitoxin system RelE/ParE family toxin [Alphaproteobacteria bacterium]|nr:type II toxin-antitoxin system RelE/ParE family toxin [Alphaproteobacteria bacterium]
MRLVFAEPAERDLDNIIDYIALDNPAAAEQVFRTIVATTERLREFPEMGRPGRLPGTREFPVASLPYVVVYEVHDDAVMILAVFHGARDLARALAQRKLERKP